MQVETAKSVALATALDTAATRIVAFENELDELLETPCDGPNGESISLSDNTIAEELAKAHNALYELRTVLCRKANAERRAADKLYSELKRELF